MSAHIVPSGVFDLLARGGGDTRGALRAGQRSKRLVLLHQVVSTMRERAGPVFAQAGGEAAFASLVESHRRAPAMVDDLLLDPHVGAWASHCLHSLLHAGRISPEDAGHLGAVAAGAALRAGRGFELTAHIRDGTLPLPSYGVARPGVEHGWCTVRSGPGTGGVEISTGDITVEVPLGSAGGNDPRWRPLHRLASTGSAGAAFVLDDVDPYRGCGHLPVAGQVTEAERCSWQARLDEAWPLLERVDRPRAEAIAAGVSHLVPLLSTAARAELSATCHQAVGAVAMTPPKDALALVLALVHEHQHTKLSALLDLVPLVEQVGGELFYAPWRPDPRPLSGLLQGLYAYLGLTGFWAAYRCEREGAGEGRLADFELALGRQQVRVVLEALCSSDRLTPAGRRFARGLKGRLTALARQPLPARVESLALMALADNRVSWRLRNVQLCPELVREWADAWLHRRPCRAPGPTEVRLTDGGGPLPSDARLQAMRLRLSTRNWREVDDRGTSAADELLLSGCPDEAAEVYRRWIVTGVDDLTSWSGLAVARRCSVIAATPALTSCPEGVRAVHTALLARSGAAPDPEELAVWMRNVATRDP